MIKIVKLTKELAVKISDQILILEKNWAEIGDEPWNIDNLLNDLPLKWDLSQLALVDNNVVGYLIASLKDNAVYLNKIVVDKSQRNFGIGKKLLKEFLKKSLKIKINKVIFKVRIDNPAVKFYEKLNFKKKDEIDKSRSDGVESYFYENNINEVLQKL